MVGPFCPVAIPAPWSFPRKRESIGPRLRGDDGGGFDRTRGPVRKGLVKRLEEWPWSSCNNFALDKEQIKQCRIQVDFVNLPESYRG
jgi:hypothetical protein